MAVKVRFQQDNGIYGKSGRDGWKTTETSGFVVFKEGQRGWAIAQQLSGLSVASLVPRWWPKTKTGLLQFVAEMEAAEPEACAKMALATGFPVHRDLRPYGQKLVDWAKVR